MRLPEAFAPVAQHLAYLDALVPSLDQAEATQLSAARALEEETACAARSEFAFLPERYPGTSIPGNISDRAVDDALRAITEQIGSRHAPARASALTSLANAMAKKVPAHDLLELIFVGTRKKNGDWSPAFAERVASLLCAPAVGFSEAEARQLTHEIIYAAAAAREDHAMMTDFEHLAHVSMLDLAGRRFVDLARAEIEAGGGRYEVANRLQRLVDALPSYPQRFTPGGMTDPSVDDPTERRRKMHAELTLYGMKAVIASLREAVAP
jgi:hypothetical protein